MIGTIFRFMDEVLEIRVIGKDVIFRSSKFGSQFVTIKELRLDKKGVLREHPDLEGRSDWRQVAIDRFREKIKKLETEKKRMDYIIDDLQKFGYVPVAQQKIGFRAKKL